MAAALRIPETLSNPSQARHGCRVCGCRELQVDAVEDARRGPLLLAECPRCDHRWTEAQAPRPVPSVRPVRRALQESASAA
jgi:hypothetical protein